MLRDPLEVVYDLNCSRMTRVRCATVAYASGLLTLDEVIEVLDILFNG